MADRPPSVEISVQNVSSAPATVVLEPWGEVHELAPGETKVVTYSGDPSPTLALDVGAGETKLWAEGPGTLDVRE